MTADPAVTGVDDHPQRVELDDVVEGEHARVRRVAKRPSASIRPRILSTASRLAPIVVRTVHGQLLAGVVERRHEQRGRRRRLHGAEGAVEQRLETVGEVAVAQVQHRRLGERAGELVGGRDDQVGAEPQRVDRQLGVEAEVRPPCLVDDERDTVAVRDVGERGDVGDGAEVRRRDDVGGDGVRVRGQGRVERGRRDAVGDAELGIDARVDEGGVEPGKGEPVDDRRVHRPLQDDALAEAAQGQARDQVALAGAVGEEPGALAAPRLRRQVGGLARAGSGRRRSRCRASAEGCRARGRAGRGSPRGPAGRGVDAWCPGTSSRSMSASA